MKDTVRVKGHSGFDHRVKVIQSRDEIDINYVAHNSGIDMIFFLCSPKYTGTYNNLPDKFYTKIEGSMNYFDSLGGIVSGLNVELYQLLENDILKKISKFKDRKIDVNELLEKVIVLSDKSRDDIIKIIKGHSKIKKVEEDTKKNTSNTLDSSDSDGDSENDVETEVSYTPYQVYSNESKLVSIDGLNLLKSLSSKFGILEAKYLKIKDDFYLLMLEKNKEFMLNNIIINSSKTYMSDELLKMFNAYICIASKSTKGLLNLFIISGYDSNKISYEEFIDDYITQSGKIEVKDITFMGLKKVSLSNK